MSIASTSISAGAALKPDRKFVSLSEALSWIAVGQWLQSGELSAALQFGPDEQVKISRKAFIKALDAFADAASSGAVSLQGKFVAYPSSVPSSPLTEVIPPHRLHDFASFDVVLDGLARGRGLAQIYSPDGFDTANEPRPGDTYRAVKVNLAELLVCFEKGGSPEAPVIKPPKPTNEAIAAKAEELRERNPKHTGRHIAQIMKSEPGFAEVTTSNARTVIDGMWPRRGPRPKSSAQ